MRHLPMALFILLLTSGFLVGCNTSGTSSSFAHNDVTGPIQTSGNRIVSNVQNPSSNFTTNTMNNTNSTVEDSNKSTGKHVTASNTTASRQQITKSGSGGTGSSNSTPSSKASSTSATKSGRGSSGASTHSGSSQVSSTGKSKTPESSGSTGGASTAGNAGTTTISRPSGIDSTWTNKFNSMYIDHNYTGPNSTLFGKLVMRMAEGDITPGAVKSDILGLKPWETVWTAANNGDGKTYEFIVHDVGAFTYQTKVLNDDITSREWQAHGQEVLDDSFYSQWAVYWNASTQEYTVAFLDVGFYLQSTN